MKNAKRKTGVRPFATAFALAAGAALVLSGCVAQQSPEQSGGGALKVGMTIAPSTLDPASACTFQDNALFKQIYVQPLQNGVMDGANGPEVDPTSAEPYLAKSFDVSENGTLYTFHLNEGWTFPSGEPMDAEAMKYSLDRALAINGCPGTIINDLYLDPPLIQEITVVDPLTVDIQLSRVDPNFPLAMATPSASIVDASLVEANGGVVADTPNEWMSSNSAGSGPFLLESYEPGVSAVLVRNDDFGGEPAASERIEISWIKSDSSMLMQVQEGSIDVAIGLSKQSASSLEKDDSKRVIPGSGTANMQLLTPMDTEPWTNVKVREAVTHAIPYEDIVSNVLFGYGDLYYGPIPPTMSGFAEQYSAAREYDMDLAKQLIEESGLETPVKVKLDIISGDAAQQSIATILQDSLGELGIEVEVQVLSESAWGDAVYGGTTQAALRLDGPAVFNAGYYLQYDENCDSPYNTGRVCVPANRELLEQARGAASPEEANEFYAEITKNWVAESPKTILYLDQAAIVTGKDVNYLWDPLTDMRTWSK